MSKPATPAKRKKAAHCAPAVALALMCMGHLPRPESCVSQQRKTIGIAINGLGLKKPAERQAAIRAYITSRGQATRQDIKQVTRSSDYTIVKDLQALKKAGHITGRQIANTWTYEAKP